MTMTMSNGSTALQHAPEGRSVDASIIERVIAAGDLSKLQPAERVAYYVATCRSVGLNPLTKPFDYISLNGKLTLYSTKNCTDQLRQIHGVSVDGLKRETHQGVHVVTATVSANGRRDEDIGAVSIDGLKGEALSNALMKATTKAKRRATLSICGLSFVDESEIESIADARTVIVTEDGEIVSPPKRVGGPIAAIPATPPSTPAAPENDGAVFRALSARIDAAETTETLRTIETDMIAEAKAKRISRAQWNELKALHGQKHHICARAEAANAPRVDPRELVKGFEVRFGEAKTMPELQAIGAEIARSPLDDQARDFLESVYVQSVERIGEQGAA